MGDRVRALRERAGLSLKEFERLAMLCGGHCWQIENDPNRTQVRTDTAVRIARLTGATVEYIASGSGRPPSDRQLRAAVNAARKRLGEAEARP